MGWTADFPLNRSKSEGRKPWRITPENLRDYGLTNIPDPGNAPARVYALAYSFLRMVFGTKWGEKYILNAKSTDFIGKLQGNNTTYDIQVHFQRVIDLAELIFNLQGIPSLENCLDQLAGGNIEATVAELDAGKMLHVYAGRFRFHAEEGKIGSDYDLDVIFQNGFRGCADTKCKIQGTKLSISSITNSLDRGRKQLDANVPGALILKVPQTWMEGTDNLRTIADAAGKFLRGTERVVCVVAYCTPVMATERGPRDGMRVRQYISKTHKFRRDCDWRLVNRQSPQVPILHQNWFRFWNIYEPLKRAVIYAVTYDDNQDT